MEDVLRNVPFLETPGPRCVEGGPCRGRGMSREGRVERGACQGTGVSREGRVEGGACRGGRVEGGACRGRGMSREGRVEGGKSELSECLYRDS